MLKTLLIREVTLKFKIHILLLLISFSFISANQMNELEARGIFSLGYKDNFAPETTVLRDLLSDEDESSIQENSFKTIKRNKLGRAVLYMGTIWLVDSIRYWATYAAWIEDWQFQLSWEDQKVRFFSLKANRFDSNPFRTNWTHGLGGAIYFNIARYHNLNLFESVLFETATSMIWEYFTEWREVVSLNDNFFSGVGGLPIGEPLFQLSKYLLSRKGTLSHIAGYILNPVFGISDLFGGKKWRSNFKEEYFSAPGLRLSLSNENFSYRDENKDSGNRFHFNIGSEFIKIPKFGNPGNEEVKLKLTTTFYSDIEFGISIDNGSIEEYNFNTKILYLGLFNQRITKRESGKLEGYSFYIGASSAYNFYKKKALEVYDKGEYHYDFTANEQPEQPTNFTDKLAIINLIGPSARLTLYSSPFKFDIEADAYFDFGLVNSFALNKYSEENDIFSPRMKTTLIHYGYYYAFGYTLNMNSKLEISNIFVSGGFRYQKYGSIQGLDRFQDEIRDDSKIYDSRSIVKGGIGYHLPGSRFSVSLLYKRIVREGTIKDVMVDEVETRIFSSLKITF